MVAQQIATKSVTFCGEVRVKYALHIDDYSDDEINATWFDDAGMQRIRKERRDTIEMMRKGAEIDEVEYSGRGLEYQVAAEGACLRRQNRIAAVYAVLDEQDMQRRKGAVVDAEMLALEYGDYTSPSQLAARAIGGLGQKIARGLTQKGDDNSRIKMDSSSQFPYCRNQRRQWFDN
jgi:hypothetical protein